MRRVERKDHFSMFYLEAIDSVCVNTRSKSDMACVSSLPRSRLYAARYNNFKKAALWERRFSVGRDSLDDFLREDGESGADSFVAKSHQSLCCIYFYEMLKVGPHKTNA